MSVAGVFSIEPQSDASSAASVLHYPVPVSIASFAPATNSPVNARVQQFLSRKAHNSGYTNAKTNSSSCSTPVRTPTPTSTPFIDRSYSPGPIVSSPSNTYSGVKHRQPAISVLNSIHPAASAPSPTSSPAPPGVWAAPNAKPGLVGAPGSVLLPGAPMPLSLDSASSNFATTATVFNASVKQEPIAHDLGPMSMGGVMGPAPIGDLVDPGPGQQQQRMVSLPAQLGSDVPASVLATGPLSPAILVPSTTPYFNPAAGPAQPPPQGWQQPYPPVYRSNESWAPPASAPAVPVPPVLTPSPGSTLPMTMAAPLSVASLPPNSQPLPMQPVQTHYPVPHPQPEYPPYAWQTPTPTPDRRVQSMTPMTVTDSVSSEHLLTPASSHIMSTPLPLAPSASASAAYPPVPMGLSTPSMTMQAPPPPNMQPVHPRPTSVGQPMYDSYAASADYNSMNATLSAWESSGGDASGSGGAGGDEPNGNGELNGGGDANGADGGDDGDGGDGGNSDDDDGEDGEQNGEGAKKRRRKGKKLLLACHFCRGRKLKCDGARPTCGHCERRRIECGYDEQVRRRGPGKRTKEMRQRAAQEAEQLQRLEAGLPALDIPGLDGKAEGEGEGEVEGEGGPGPSTLAEYSNRNGKSNRGRKRKSDMAMAAAAVAAAAAAEAEGGHTNGDGVDDDEAVLKRAGLGDDSLHLHHLEQLQHHQLNHLHPHTDHHTHDEHGLHQVHHVMHDDSDVFKLDNVDVDDSVLASLHPGHALDPALAGVGVDALANVDPDDLGQVDPGTLGQVIQQLSGGQH